MTALVNKLREARQGPNVILMRYNQRRSAHIGKFIIAVEGSEDIAFYETMMKRVLGEEIPAHHFFDCKGKDNVLDLKDILERNLSEDSQRVLYFVDHDFDGLKGRSAHPRLYVTSVYSIENHLCSRKVLEALLDSEFKCSLDGHDQDRNDALIAYDKFMASYSSELFELNKCIFMSRKTSAFEISTDCSITDRIRVTPLTVSFNASKVEEVLHLLDVKISLEDILKIYENNHDYIDAFSSLDPILSWRGKYIYHIFIRFLKSLIEDRGRRNNRVVFAKRANVQLAPHEGAVRLFASVAAIPQCLRQFLLSSGLNQGAEFVAA